MNPAADRSRRRLVPALIALAAVIGFLAVLALWAERQLLEEDTWVATSTELLEDEEISDALAVFLVDELYSDVDVKAELQQGLPPQLDDSGEPVTLDLGEIVTQLGEQQGLDVADRIPEGAAQIEVLPADKLTAGDRRLPRPDLGGRDRALGDGGALVASTAAINTAAASTVGRA